MNEVLKALQFRHACKKFDADKTIPNEVLKEILECGHLSASSFGMEPWKFLVIKNNELRQKLRKTCWDQAQITDSSHVIVILDKKDKTKPDTDYIKDSFKRRNMSSENEQTYIKVYKEHYAKEIQPNLSNYAWDSKQCYNALSNLMTSAASAGVDSCPIEGFDKSLTEECLGLDKSEYEVVVVLALGYRLEEQTPRLRLDFDEVVEFIK